MKQVIRLNEKELKQLIRESIIDTFKSKMWNAIHTPPAWGTIQGYNKQDDIQAHNPYTYNKANFHDKSPKYGTREFKKMYGSKDGWIVSRIQRDMANLNDFLNNKPIYIGMDTVFGFTETDLELAQEYGLTDYYDYLLNLYDKAKGKYEQNNDM